MEPISLESSQDQISRRLTGDSSSRAVSTVEGLVFLMAIALSTLGSICLAADLSSPDRTIVWVTTDGPGGGGGSGGGANSAETNSPLSYGVIGLGTNYTPIKITASGKILASQAVWDPADQSWHSLAVSLPSYQNHGPAFGLFNAVDMNDQGEIVGSVNLDHGYATNVMVYSNILTAVTTNSDTAGVVWSPGSYNGTVHEGQSFTYAALPLWSTGTNEGTETNQGTLTNTYQSFVYVAVDGTGAKYSEQADGSVGPQVAGASNSLVWVPFRPAINLYQESTPLTAASWSTDGNANEIESGQAGGLLGVSSGSGNFVYYTYPIAQTNNMPSTGANAFTIMWNNRSYYTTSHSPIGHYFLNNSNWMVGPSFDGFGTPTLFRGPSGSTQPLPVSPIGISDRSYTDSGGNPHPDYQILSTNSIVESATDNNGNPNGIYGPPTVIPISNGLAQGWSNASAVSFNNIGEIVGSAVDAPQNVALPPCQFRLLNGSQNGHDGMDFNGNRPITITATASYIPTSQRNENKEDNGGFDQIGVLPLDGSTQQGTSSQYGYVSQIFLLAKVPPTSTTSATYDWERYYQDQVVTVEATPTNTWYVSETPNNATGFPVPIYDSQNRDVINDTPMAGIISIGDSPGMALDSFKSAQVNDYAYEKTDFTYYATNTCGNESSVSVEHVGQIMAAKRLHVTGTDSYDWIGLYNNVSTTNIPDCRAVSVSEIRKLVYPSTNQIIFDSSVPSSP